MVNYLLPVISDGPLSPFGYLVHRSMVSYYLEESVERGKSDIGTGVTETLFHNLIEQRVDVVETHVSKGTNGITPSISLLR